MPQPRALGVMKPPGTAQNKCDLFTVLENENIYLIRTNSKLQVEAESAELIIKSRDCNGEDVVKLV